MLSRIACRNATTPEDLNLVFDLRHKVLVEELARIPQGLVWDTHDAVAHNFIVCVGAAPVGTVRVISDSDLVYSTQPSFSIEKRVDLSPYRKPGRAFMEVSRLAVLPPYRKIPSRVVLALVGCAYKYARAHSITDAFILANCEMDSGNHSSASLDFPRIFTGIGFRPIGDIREPGYYDGFGVYTAPMHLSREDLAGLAQLYESSHIDDAITYVSLSHARRLALYHEVQGRMPEGRAWPPHIQPNARLSPFSDSSELGR